MLVLEVEIRVRVRVRVRIKVGLELDTPEVRNARVRKGQGTNRLEAHLLNCSSREAGLSTDTQPCTLIIK